MQEGVDAWGGQPLSPPTARHNPLMEVEPQLPLIPGPLGHQTAPGWRSYARPTRVCTPPDCQVSTSCLIPHLC